MRRALGWLCAALAAVACERAEPPPGASAGAPPSAAAPENASEPAPAMLRATVVLEPPRVSIGGLFTVEVAVVTPPGHRVAPVPAPKAVPGLVVVDAARPSIDQEPGRWVHRQRFRARASATGPFRWPALELAVEAPDGSTRSVTAAERPFEVISLLAEQPERRSPYSSYRLPRLDPAGGRGPWLPALLGSLGTLAALGLFAGVRHVRAIRLAAATDGGQEPEDAEYAGVLAALAHAEAAAHEPVHAADLASQALRDWAAERFRAPLLRFATTEELAARAPPFLLTTRYPALIALLQGLDALRFPPEREQAAQELHAALARARAFVAGAASPRP